LTNTELAECAIAALSSQRFAWSSETGLHSAIEGVLTLAALPLEREVDLGPGSRVDFLVGGVGVEVKIDGSLADVTRQLHRYSESDRIEVLVLVSTKMRHRSVPRTMNGKPIHFVCIGGWL